MIKTGFAKIKVMKWTGLCREVCRRVLSRQHKFTGTEDFPVQIGEAYFRGKCKYNRGRFRRGDLKHKGKDKAREEEESSAGDTHCGPYTVLRSKSNHANRVMGPWVFGICQSKFCVRFFVLPDRRSRTLIPIIKAHFVQNSFVRSHE